MRLWLRMLIRLGWPVSIVLSLPSLRLSQILLNIRPRRPRHTRQRQDRLQH